MEKSDRAAGDQTAALRKASALDFPIVGIGASAGGVQALIRFFEHMPRDPGMAFVVVLHLSPSHESQADNVLRRVTRLPVQQVTEATPIEKNHVYLISPATALSMTDGYLSVTPSGRGRSGPVAIDLFFRSLAEAHGERAISVVLSGTGSDGAVGIGRIKECGGITLAQSPEDAEYAEMPANAMATGQVDIVLPVVDIPQKLIELSGNARSITLPDADADMSGTAARKAEGGTVSAEHALQHILKALRVRTGHDFQHYKRATVLRRIERRLQVNSLPDLPAYQRFVETHPDETGALLRDMLIGVTNFFRDREAFEAVEREVVPAIIGTKAEGESVRAWVAGCSTGEEAYSLAMLFSEGKTEGTELPKLQIFATDLDQQAIEVARTGSYPESILTDVAPARLRRFFALERGRFVINKALRESVLFAPHNVLRDPPFSHLDLVSCRNLLIYLDRSVQRQVFETFHFALQPGGFLFLGTSESVDIADDLFSTVDKKNRIYRARALATKVPSISSPAVTGNQAPAPRPFAPAPMRDPASLTFATLHQQAIERYAPPSVLIDRNAEILHMSDDVGRFLRYVGGEPSHNLLTLINPDLGLELRTALFQALQNGRSVDAERVRFSHGATHSYVNMTVRPFNDATNSAVYCTVFFDEVEETTRPDEAKQTNADQNPLVAHLESELHRTKELLRLSIEQSNASNEELKASNEELQAINEEMRSATEELETSKEELQSVNEELVTVNGTLQAKVEETAKANDDLQNLIASTGIATIFVDSEMRITRYTAPAVGLFNLIETDIGRSLFDLTHRLIYPELAADASATFQSLQITQREVSTTSGEWYLVRLLPYRTGEDRIDGAVLTLIDITERRVAQQEVRQGEERLKLAALATDDYAIIVQDLDGRIVTWNRGAQRVFGYDEREVLGKPIDLIFTPEDRAQNVAVRERETAKTIGRAEDERWHQRKDGRRIYCSGVMTTVTSEGFTGLAKIVRDMTDRKSVESQQQMQLELERATRAQAESVNRQKDEFFAVLSHELKNPLNLIHVKAELLSRAPDARNIPLVQDAAQAIQRSVISQAKIIDDLLDLSRVRTGKLALNFADVDLAAVVRSVTEACTTDAENGGIALSTSRTDTALVIQADSVRVEQMLWNLVRNALKFTPRGGSVRVALSEDNRFACIEVKDTGKGIAPEFLSKVFDMFSQAEGSVKRDSSGLGIGLSLTKQLAEMHGGRIEAESAGIGRGACFRLRLPKRSPLAMRSNSPAVADAGILKGLRVLLVDDSIEGLEALGALLEIEGAQVTVESSAQKALALAVDRQFDLILSDIAMPGMSGYDLIEALRKQSNMAKVPAIALTGFGREQDAARALRAGFDAHLGKPVTLNALLHVIGAIM
ncbi:CheR family methyltransferase [Paraburkholderia sp. SIMBA_053]|uniref:CheR family methyltransferase n=1 Tax=Paraburkholderia sp. SIMBA_053 TaxID=3085794 RepID=UPI00397C1DE5